MVKISVIIPVYNVEPYLERCLDSVINQTLKDIEIICINDCSTDNSFQILKEYALKDKRIKLIDLPRNVGVGNVRNYGIDEANGEYLGFIDSDDYIDLDFYERLYLKAEETGADIIRGETKIYNTKNMCLKNNMNETIKKYNSKLFFAYFWVTAIYKKKLINENHIRFKNYLLGEDILFLNEAIIKSNKLEVVNNTFYHYVKRENSTNSTILTEEKIISTLIAHEKILDNVLEYYKTHQEEKSGVRFICEWSLYNAVEYTYRLKTIKNMQLCIDIAFKMYNKIKKYLQVLNFNSLLLEMPYFENNDREGLIKYYQDNDTAKKRMIANVRCLHVQKMQNNSDDIKIERV